MKWGNRNSQDFLGVTLVRARNEPQVGAFFQWLIVWASGGGVKCIIKFCTYEHNNSPNSLFHPLILGEKEKNTQPSAPKKKSGQCDPKASDPTTHVMRETRNYRQENDCLWRKRSLPDGLSVFAEVEDPKEAIDLLHAQAPEAEGAHQLLEQLRDRDAGANRSRPQGAGEPPGHLASP